MRSLYETTIFDVVLSPQTLFKRLTEGQPVPSGAGPQAATARLTNTRAPHNVGRAINCRIFNTLLLKLRYRVVTTCMKWVTARNTFYTHPTTTYDTETVYCFVHIHGTGWFINA